MSKRKIDDKANRIAFVRKLVELKRRSKNKKKKK